VEAEGSAVSPTATTNTKKRVKKIQTVISSSSNTFTQSKKKDAKDKMHHQQQQQQLLEERCDPKRRGIHPDDALMVGMAPTSASTCVDCHTKIVQGSIRFGIKYAGNPLPNIPVIPLYGTHPVPMYMWCHAGTGDTTTTGTSSQNRRLPCGLSYCRLSKTMSDAERTCHACQFAIARGKYPSLVWRTSQGKENTSTCIPYPVLDSNHIACIHIRNSQTTTPFDTNRIDWNYE
jgi:hypothetical protein